MSSLEAKYKTEIVPSLMKEFKHSNVMEVPRVEKVVVNMGVGDAKDDPKLLDSAVKELALITGQKAVVTRARKSVSAFKVREGMAIGCKVTLRGKRMYDFLEKLFNMALPRVRDFRGISPDAFDGRGNYTLGLKEQLVFPEVDYDDVAKIRGMDVTIVTTAKTDEEARELLKQLGAPFKEA